MQAPLPGSDITTPLSVGLLTASIDITKPFPETAGSFQLFRDVTDVFYFGVLIVAIGLALKSTASSFLERAREIDERNAAKERSDDPPQ